MSSRMWVVIEALALLSVIGSLLLGGSATGPWLVAIYANLKAREEAPDE